MKLFSAIQFTIFSFAAFSQTPFPSKPGMTVIDHKQDPFIEHGKRPLNWNDYIPLAQPPDTMPQEMVAATTTTITFVSDCIGGQLHFSATALFSKKKSWVLRTGMKDGVLKHEQLHFDITELFARMLRKKISEIKNPCLNLNQLNILYHQFLSDSEKENHRYDSETNNGRIPAKQQQWENDIVKRLSELPAYK
jgi:poly(3-hydroxyalkanoate) synthetase